MGGDAHAPFSALMSHPVARRFFRELSVLAAHGTAAVGRMRFRWNVN